MMWQHIYWPGSSLTSSRASESTLLIGAVIALWVFGAALGTSANAQLATWTTSADFASGTMSGVQTATYADQLQLEGASSVTEPYIYIANYRYGTISKVNTITALEEARYPACLNNVGNTNLCPTGNALSGPYIYCNWSDRGHCPSRTAVDLNGDVWVANRAFGRTASATKIAGKLSRCVDRNGNGVIDTSQDLSGNGRIDLTESENMPPQPTGEWKGQDDECVLFTVPVGPNNMWGRGLAVDALNRIWFSSFNNKNVFVLNASNGAVLHTYNHGSSIYGLAPDALGFIYNSDIDLGIIRQQRVSDGVVVKSIDTPRITYGIAAHPTNQTVWLGVWEQRGALMKVDFSGATVSFTEYRNSTWGNTGRTRGVAIDNQGRVWVANFDAHRLGMFNPTTNTWGANYVVGNSPIGVAIDKDNRIWTANGSNTATRVDPVSGQVVNSPTLGVEPYSYSDMTGYQLTQGVVQQGSWEVTYDSGIPGLEWGKIWWNQGDGTCPAQGCVPSGTLIEVEARAYDGALPQGEFVTANHGEYFVGVYGQTLELRVKLRVTGGGTISPVLKDVRARATHLPEIYSASPSQVPVGFVGNIALTGDAFKPGTTFDFGPLIGVTGTEILSDTQAMVSIAVDPGHPAGPRQVDFDNGVLSHSWSGFSVQLPSPALSAVAPNVVGVSSEGSLSFTGQWLSPSASLQTTAGSLSSAQWVSLQSISAQFAAPSSPQLVSFTATTPAGSATLASGLAVYGISAVTAAPIPRGSSGSVLLHVVGLQGNDTLQISGLNPGAPNYGAGTLTSSLAVPAGAPVGLYAAQVTAPSLGLTHTRADAVRVILPPVQSLVAEPRPQGGIYLDYSPPEGGGATAYRIYRKNSSFSDISQATLVATVAGAVHIDVPPAAGAWFYGVVAVDSTGFSGALGGNASALSDPTPPTAAFATSAPWSTGPHPVTLTASEPLSGLPVASVTLPGGLSLPLALSASAGNSFVATVQVPMGTPSGQAELSWSGTDIAGNTGTNISSGRFVTIDTAPPTMAFAFAPASPVGAGPVLITATASENLAGAPSVWLSPAGAAPILLTATGGPKVWSTSFEVLPGTPNGAAILTFSGVDSVGNPGTQVTSGASLVIDTVPPAPPTLSGTKQPGGSFQLAWAPPAGESGLQYRLYRASKPFTSPGDATLIATTTSTSFTDQAPTEGQWSYRLTARDAAGNVSALSNEVLLLADPPPPEDVTNLAVTSAAASSLATSWTASANASGLLDGYRAYRNGALVATLPKTATTYIFGSLQAGSSHTLKITAFDSNSRESIGATLVGHTWVNPPTNVSATPRDNGANLSWTASPGPALASYAIYAQPAPFASVAGLSPVATAAKTATSHILTALTNGTEVWVAVVAVNNSGGYNPVASPVAVTPQDVNPPEPPTALIATSSFATSVGIAWTASVNTAGDLAGYRVLVDGNLAAELSSGATGHTLTDLNPASAYSVQVRAFDGAGNQSSAASLVAYTWLPHPATVSLTSHDRSLKVTWSHAQPSNFVGQYRIYVSAVDFALTSGLSPAVTAAATATSATISGLDNGAVYYVAVAAVNKSGGMDPAIYTTPGSPADDAPPPNPSQLVVQSSGPTSALVSFVGSNNSAGDLAGYRVYVEGGLFDTLPPGATNVLVVDLPPASKSLVRISAFDTVGNESAGATLQVYTWVPNPAGVQITSEGHQRLDVAWLASQPSSHVAAYRIYAQTGPFSSVAGLSPTAQVAPGALSRQLSPLLNNVAYHVAVTAVTHSGGEDPTVVPVQGTPQPDTSGPTLGALTFAGAALLEGGTIANDGTFSIQATDPQGIGYARFSVDGAVIGIDQTPSNGLTAFWSIHNVLDDAHTLLVEVFDALGNGSSLERTFSVVAAAPGAPSIQSPGAGFATNQAQVLVVGAGKPFTTARVYVNAEPHPTTAVVNGAGNFSLQVPLTPGTNELTATVAGAGGESPHSPMVQVLYDNSTPGQPKGLGATPREGGLVKLEWFSVVDSSLSGLKGYRVYRAAQPFSSPAEAVLVTPSAIKSPGFTDLPPSDGLWHYAVLAENNAGTQSALSLPASAQSDGSAPYASALVFLPEGAYDPTTHRAGVGPLGVRLTFNEPLMAAPFVSLAVPGAQPLPVGMGVVPGTQGLIWQGQIHIASTSPTGLATVVLSARDLVGNRGTLIAGNPSISLDTQAPKVIQLSLQPEAPIQNHETAPVTVAVHLVLSEPLPEGESPELLAALSSSPEAPIQVVLAQIDADEWTGGFTLPTYAGLAPETLAFSYLGVDDLGNTETHIEGKSSFEVYQGTLPALSAPVALSATAQPGGAIALNWPDVPLASEYQIYRKASGQPDFVALVRAALSEWVDITPQDGSYNYAVATIRSANGQQAESALGPSASATADSTAPGAPTGLQAALAANGIALNWQAPSPLSEPITYRIYRASGLEITSLGGLSPLATGLTALLAVDPTPSTTQHAYVVAAVDAVGNVSPPSNSVYINPGLLPVSSLFIAQDRRVAGSPTLTWTHPSSSLSGYVLTADGGALAPLQAAANFTDSTYGSGGRTYGVRAVDLAQQESLERTLRLIPVTVAAAPGAEVVRHQIAPVDFDVFSPEAVSGVTLRVRLDNKDHISAPFSVAAGQTTRVPVVVGGYPALPSAPVAAVTTRREPNSGERVDLMDSVGLGSRTGGYAAQVVDLDLERGAVGTARFLFTNTGPVPVELLLAKSNGNASSDQVRLAVLDGDGNVLSTAAVRQSTGGVITLTNGSVVARVMPGDTFSSLPFDLPVPASAPDMVQVRLTIDWIHYDLGKASQVSVPGLSTTAPGSLVEPPYVATVEQAEPALSYGGEPIAISGTATSTETSGPAANVPITLVIRLDGFVRTYALFTDALGQFSYTFTPTPNEGGIYEVWAKYPGLLNQPVQRTFVIQRVLWNPTSPSVTLPTGYPVQLAIGVGTGKGTPLSALQLEPGVLPTGIGFEAAAPKDLAGGSNGVISATLTASTEAPTSGTFSAEIVSQERTWGTLQIKFARTNPTAQLTAKPTYVETGVVRGGLQAEEVVITNKGLAAAQDVTIALLNAAKTAPAPSWAQVVSASALGSLPGGASKPVTLAFAPTQSTALSGATPYSFILRASSQGQTLLEMPVYAWVSESGQGSVLFKAVDMYTGTVNQQGQLVLGLAGAKIKLDRLLGAPLSISATTDGTGEAFLPEVPAGNYRFRVSAPGHDAIEGNLQVKPGMTATEEVFLPIPFITIEWDVTEITIQDKYQILLSATFETDVPAPVVVIEPPSINLPPMQPGDVFLGEIKISNFGLIKTQNTTFKLPNGGADYAFELLAPIPEELAAKSSVTVPYRVVKLDSGLGGNSSGGGCGVKAYWGGVSYGWACINGNWVWAAFPVVFLVTDTSTCSTGAPKNLYVPGPGPGGPGGGGCCGGGWSGPTWKPKSTPDKPCDECDHPTKKPLERECCKKKKEKVTSEVDLVTGDYSFAASDLPVRVLGWHLQFRRSYTQGVWEFEFIDDRIEMSTFNGQVSEIRLGTLIFTATDGDSQVFDAGDGYRIFATGDAALPWRLEARNGGRFIYDIAGRLGRIENERGHSVTFTRDASGRLISAADTFGTVVAQATWSGSNLASLSCPLDGRTVQYTWTSGRLTKVVDAEGRQSTYTYNGSGLLTLKREPGGRASHLTYSPSAMVVSVLDDAGQGVYLDYGFNAATEQYYSASTFTDGRLIERWFNRGGLLLKTVIDGVEQKAASGAIKAAVDSKGQITGAVGPGGDSLESRQYDAKGRLTRRVDGRGIAFDFTYDAAGNVLSETRRQGVGGPLLGGVSYGYDAVGRLVSKTLLGTNGAADQTTVYENDDAGNVVREERPGGVVIEREFDAQGSPLRQADGQGNVVEWQYDAVGRLVERRVTTAASAQTVVEQWSYAADLGQTGVEVGTRVSHTDPDSRQTVERQDPAGRPVEVVDAWGRSTRFAYDTAGQLVRLESPDGQVMTVEREVLPSGLSRQTRVVDGVVTVVEDRDAQSRLVRRQYAGEEAHYFYEGESARPVEIVQPGGRTLLDYDAFGNVISKRTLFDDGREIEELGTYSGARLLESTDAQGDVRQTLYSPEGLPASFILPSGRALTTEFDGAGRPVSYPSASSDSALTVTFGAGNQIARRTLPSGAWLDYETNQSGEVAGIQTSWGPRVEATLDTRGNPLSKRWYAQADQEDPADEASYSYDSTGKLTLSQNNTVAISAEHDWFARTTTTTFNFGPLSKSFTVLRDSLGREVGLIMPDGTAYGYEYDAFGRVQSVVLPDGDSVDFEYPSTLQVARTYPNGVSTTQVRDIAQLPVSVSAEQADGTSLLQWNYALQGRRVSQVTTTEGDFAFSYDVDGQIVEASYPSTPADAFSYDVDGNRITSSAAGPLPWTYNAADQLLAAGQLGASTWHPSGDLASRQFGGQTQNYEYDAAGRLHIVRDAQGQVVAEYGYSADGLRVVKKVGAQTTYAIYGDRGLLAEYDETGAELRRYIWLPTRGWQHNLVAYEATGLRYFPVLDARDEVIGLTDPAGQWAWRAELRVFGEAIIHPSSSIGFSLRPSGQVHDPETGLHYNTSRYYDPSTGRYIQTDPLLELSGERNLYAFAWNNPLDYEDRYGWLPNAKGTWECTSPFSPASWKDGGCSGGGEVEFPVTPWVTLKVSLTVNSNFRDCCDKNGNIILQGKGCLEVKLSGSAEVGFDPIGALLRKVAGMAGNSMAAGHIMPEDDFKSPVAIQFVKITLSGSCNFCGECGDLLTSPTNFDRCCLGLEVEGPNLSVSIGAFKLTATLFKVEIGQVCFGPYGWDFVPPGFKGPSGGLGSK